MAQNRKLTGWDFDRRIENKKGRRLTTELLKRQPNLKTLSKKAYDADVKKQRENAKNDDNRGNIYTAINNMPYHDYRNMSIKNRLRLREIMTTPEGHGIKRIKNLSNRNVERFKQSRGRTNETVAMGRQRNTVLLPALPNMRFKPVPVLGRPSRIENKVRNFMTYVDNAGIINDFYERRFSEMIQDILRFIGEDKYLIKIVKKDFEGLRDGVQDTLTMPINQDGLEAIQAWITDIYEGGGYEQGTIEFGDYQQYKDNLEVSFYMLPTKNKRSQFFKHILLKNYDLDILQIYKSVEEAELKYDTHCFVHSCEVLGVGKDTLIRLKHCLNNKPVISKNYPQLCNILRRNMRFKKLGKDATDSQKRKDKNIKRPTNAKYKIEADKKPFLDFVWYEGHIMPEIKIPISSFSIKNYEDVKDLKNFERIHRYQPRNEKYERSYKNMTTTTIIIKCLIDSNSFKYSYDMEKLSKNINLEIHEVSGELEYEQRPFTRRERIKVPLESIYYADLECLTSKHINDNDEQTLSHRAFMAGYVPHEDTYINKLGEESKVRPHIFRAISTEQVKYSTPIYDMLDHICKRNNKFRDHTKSTATVEVLKQYPYIVYFHNLKYDFTFFKRLNIRFKSICEKAGAIYSVEFIHKGKTFILRDSFKLLSFGLGQFKKNLNLDIGKADFEMYDYFNDTNLNMDDEINYKGHMIKPLTTYINYLKLDCLTLKAGVKKLYESLKSFDEYLNVYNFLTISSLAYDYFGHCGGWDGLYEISGSVLKFVNKSSVGGRCCLKDNKKIVCNPSKEDLEYLKSGENYNEKEVLILLNMLLEDFDMKSCYPSAIKISKFPVGMAKKLNKKQIEELNLYYKNKLNKVEQVEIIGDLYDYETSVKLKSYSHVIFDVDIKFTGYLQIPILSVKKDSGTRLWTNNINETITISSVYLQDMIDTGYYNIESIDIKHGIYWNQGYNVKCQEIIQRLYNERAEYKDETNPKYNICMSECLKLILNSIYGKCGLKASETEIMIKTKEKTESYIINNFDDVPTFTSLNDTNNELKVKVNTYGHHNMAHISSLILENSKVLMNHVIKSAENVGCVILYTDTDSFHIEKSKIPELVKEYKKLFNKELIGKQLTQFETDFTPIYVNDAKYPQYSTKFLSPGLKWYMDDLEHVENNIISNIKSQHIRNKGLDKVNVEYYIKSKKLTMTQLYLSFIRGDTHIIDLCKGKARFEFKNFGVSCKESMLKEFKF